MTTLARVEAEATGGAGSSRPITAEGLRSEFAIAADHGDGPFDRTFEIASGIVTVRYATESMAELLSRPLAHLVRDRANHAYPDLRINVWETGVAQHDPRFSSTRAGASHHLTRHGLNVLLQPVPGILSAFSARDAEAWFSMPSAENLPYWDRSSPFRHLLGWWLESRGCELVHGGAVATSAGGVLFAGRGGSGKSTSALASVLGGALAYAGDDYVAVTDRPAPWVHSLYCSAKLERGHLDRLPQLNALVANADRASDDKAIVYVDDLSPGVAVRGFPLRAIVVPRITTRTSPAYFPTSHAAALRALAPSTLLQRRPPRPDSFTALTRLVERVPAYELEIGTELQALGAVVEQLVADACAREEST
jgi:hypothetical protein